VILFVGRISAEKSLHTLIEALPAVLARVPAAQLVLCGPPAGIRSPLPTRERRELAGRPDWRARYAAHLQRVAEPLGDRVVFAGRISEQELPLAYALAAVYVQPSLFESFGLPVAEAMASEVPVVATATGGLLDLVEHGETGYLVPIRERDALGDAVAQVLLDPALAERFGRAGRAAVLRRLTWDHAADRLHSIYKGLFHQAELAPTA
jgi:glycosyltransferase involved in cell wall biosynthesis